MRNQTVLTLVALFGIVAASCGATPTATQVPPTATRVVAAPGDGDNAGRANRHCGPVAHRHKAARTSRHNGAGGNGSRSRAQSNPGPGAGKRASRRQHTGRY